MRAQVGADSLVGEGTRIDSRCSVKRTIIGRHCTIGRNVKLTNVILMDRVTIQDGYTVAVADGAVRPCAQRGSRLGARRGSVADDRAHPRGAGASWKTSSWDPCRRSAKSAA